MSLSHKGFFIVVLLSMFLGLSGCGQNGSAEKAGEKIDQATENAGDQIDQATENAGDQI